MHRQPSCAADKRDELAAPHVLPTVRGSYPSTSLQGCRVVHYSKIDRRMAEEMGRKADMRCRIVPIISAGLTPTRT
jgi:hypothetical protein